MVVDWLIDGCIDQSFLWLKMQENVALAKEINELAGASCARASKL